MFIDRKHAFEQRRSVLLALQRPDLSAVYIRDFYTEHPLQSADDLAVSKEFAGRLAD